MCTIPLDLQRRFEQRWAARFQQQGGATSSRGGSPEKQDQQLATPRKAKRKTRQNMAASRSAPAA